MAKLGGNRHCGSFYLPCGPLLGSCTRHCCGELRCCVTGGEQAWGLCVCPGVRSDLPGVEVWLSCPALPCLCLQWAWRPRYRGRLWLVCRLPESGPLLGSGCHSWSQRKISDFVLGFVSPERLEGPRWWLGMSVHLWGAARSSRKWVGSASIGLSL